MDHRMRTAGVDVGGTKVAVASLDGPRLSQSLLEPTAGEDPEALLAQISRMVRSLGDGIEAVGVGVPSVVRLSDGMVMSSANIAAFRDVPLRDALGERLGIPVRVDNDANVAALSEAWDDDLRLRYASLACVTVGTGVGSGIVIGGRPLHGSRTSAAELGHLIVAADVRAGAPPSAPAPHPDSLERWGSGRALDRLADERGIVGGGTGLTDAALAGDASAIEALRILGERVGIGIAAVITLLEPEAVVIGGGVSRAGELLVAPARDAARRLLLPGLGTETVIRVAQHGPQAGVRGAALLARILETDRP